MGRSPSTISRELRRNAATRGGDLEYRATTTQWHADRRARRPKVAKLAENEPLRQCVQDRLAARVTAPGGTAVPGPEVSWIGRRHGRRQDRRWAKSWSPEPISNRLRVDFPDDETMRISHEAIYQALYVQGRGALRRELVACLRTGRALRVPRARTRGRGKKFVSAEIMISERPAEVEDRAVPGHWEGDLILGLDSSAIGTSSSAPPDSPCCCEQFTSWAFAHRARQSGLAPSMGSIGDCFDNAAIELFWAWMQVELLNRQRWRTRIELANAIFEYLEIFHNRQRRHSSLGMRTPNEYERIHHDNPLAALPSQAS